MSITLSALQRQRYDTAANWTAANPTLLAGELGIESDTKKFKIGDGSTAWTALAYLPGSEISVYPIVNADIAAAAEIAVSKLQDGTARQLLQTDAAGTGVEWASNIDVPGTLDVTGAATFDNNVTIQGDLTVNGTTTTIDTTTLVVEDKNIEMGAVTTPSDATADGGGITLKGATDKTINWLSGTGAWTFSEHVNIASGKEYQINGTSVLSGTTLGSGVTGSSLTSVGTITSGTWNGTAIATAYIADDAVTADKLANTGVTAGSYTAADITVDEQGRITSAASGTISTAEIADDAVTSAKIADDTIVNADINASAAIAGTKISPDFGTQAITTSGDLTLNAQADLRFGDADSSNWVAFQAPGTVATNVTWTLPAADATVSGHALKSDGSGNLSWGTAGGAAGGGTDDVFYENSQTVNSSYTLTANKNAMSAGPITIGASATVTIPSGQTWVIV